MNEAEYVHGTFNVDKCVKYLRGIGAEITDEQVQQWQDAQATHRYLRRLKRARHEVWLWCCAKGHETIVRSWDERVRRTGTGDTYRVQPKCHECGGALFAGTKLAVLLRDGTIVDRRPHEHRWTPVDTFFENYNGKR